MPLRVVVAQERHGGAVRRMEAVVPGIPGRSAVLTETDPNGGRRDDKIRIGRVRADLVDVGVDIDRRLPGRTAVRRAWDASNVNVREQRPPVRRGRYRANPEWWSDALAIDDGRARIPCVSTLNGLEAAELFDVAICAHAQDTRIVCPDVNHVADWRAARQLKLARTRAYATRRRRCVGEASVPRRWRGPRRARPTQAR